VVVVAIVSFWKRVMEMGSVAAENDSSRRPRATACDTPRVSDQRAHAPSPPVDPAERADASAALAAVREAVEPALEAFLSERRVELAAMDPGSAVLVDELLRLIAAGGKRIRPGLCSWSYRAARGRPGPAIVRAAAALELLHTFALIHDDVMDGAAVRRGVETTHVRFAKDAPPGAEPERYGGSMAILAGDLAAVLAEQLLRTCGAPAGPLAVAFGRFDRMRSEMAVGQYLDLGAAGGAASPRVAALKTGSYTADGPVLIGTALAEAGPAVEGPLRTYSRLLGEAFQLRDDVLDGDAPSGDARRVDDLVDRAASALEAAPLDRDGAAALVEIARLLRLGRR
jgi:geranylgeranyl diphosphate synthase type I